VPHAVSDAHWDASIIENATEACILTAHGSTKLGAEAIAMMTVSCLNRVRA
jgi:hypothetical protein